jgi:hypothetical protein
MLVDNKFVILLTPRNASTSLYASIHSWRIPIDFGSTFLNEYHNDRLLKKVDFAHKHSPFFILKSRFPNKPIYAIKRNSTDRFVSCLNYLIFASKATNFDLKYDYENMSEDEIITIFTDIIGELNRLTIDGEIKYDIINDTKNIVKKYINEDYVNFPKIIGFFQSQFAWGVNKCDYVIDIENIKEIETLIRKEIKPNFNLIKANESKLFDFNLKLIKNRTSKLDDFVFNVIDKPFIV